MTLFAMVRISMRQLDLGGVWRHSQRGASHSIASVDTFSSNVSASFSVNKLYRPFAYDALHTCIDKY